MHQKPPRSFREGRILQQEEVRLNCPFLIMIPDREIYFNTLHQRFNVDFARAINDLRSITKAKEETSRVWKKVHMWHTLPRIRNSLD